MTRELLKRYQDILAEIDDLTSHAVDTVQASHADYPYTMHTVKIEGGDYMVGSGRAERLAVRRAEQREIGQFIEGLPNVRLKRIAKLYANRKSWAEIAKLTNCKSPDAARMLLSRYLEK